MHTNELFFFSTFIVFILSILLFDLGVFSKNSHTIKFKEAIIWTIIWVSFAIGFYFFLLFYGHELHGIKSLDDIKNVISTYHLPITIPNDYQEALNIYRNNMSLEFITGYLIEYSLSVDNVFVIILIFYSFNVRTEHYKRVLFWGILGAIIMRFIFIFLSSTLIQNFSFILYIFGGFLVFTGVKMFVNRNDEEKIETSNHPVVKFASKYFPIWPDFSEHRFIHTHNNKRYITPLFLTLLVVEFSDIIFAVDSVPAIFSVTEDPYIVFFSNIFAILGLRSLFFLVVNFMHLFHYLKVGLAVLLSFIGIKMLFQHYLELIGFKTIHSLFIILAILTVSIVASLLFPKKSKV